MKKIEYYLGLPYKLELVPDTEEGGYVADYPELPGCLTVGESMNRRNHEQCSGCKKRVAARSHSGRHSNTGTFISG